MIFNSHSELKDKHALLSPSKYNWLNYDADRLIQYYVNSGAADRGTKIHAFAATCITLHERLPKKVRTLNMYVNDAIGFNMEPEKPLYYSKFCFGTPDAIVLRSNVLRIHDLKTGVTPAHMEQLYIYASLFCLEYKVEPETLKMELRIYQNDEIVVDKPYSETIRSVMNTIVQFTDLLNKFEIEGAR